jgi:hypothetical protein
MIHGTCIGKLGSTQDSDADFILKSLCPFPPAFWISTYIYIKGITKLSSLDYTSNYRKRARRNSRFHCPLQRFVLTSVSVSLGSEKSSNWNKGQEKTLNKMSISYCQTHIFSFYVCVCVCACFHTPSFAIFCEQRFHSNYVS